MDSNMKMILGAVAVVAVLLIVWMIWKKMESCKEDKDCLNGGKCTKGKCVCNAGYKGAFCKDKVTA